MDETIIERIRGAMALSMSLDDLMSHFEDVYTPEQIFLAYHASVILETPYNG